MAIHFRDKERLANPERPQNTPFRLFGFDDDDKPYFYWSDVPAKYGACYGKNKKWFVWGTLECRSGIANIKDENRIFVAEYETLLLLEANLGFRPCRRCNENNEYQRWVEKYEKN